MSYAIPNQPWRHLTSQASLLLKTFQHTKNDLPLYHGLFLQRNISLHTGLSMYHVLDLSQRREMPLLTMREWMFLMDHYARHRNDIYSTYYDMNNWSVSQWMVQTLNCMHRRSDAWELAIWVDVTKTAIADANLGVEELYHFFRYIEQRPGYCIVFDCSLSKDTWDNWCEWCEVHQFLSQSLIAQMKNLKTFDDEYRLKWLQSVLEIEKTLSLQEISCY